MNITLNGNNYESSENISISELLTSLGLTGKPVVIEHNKIAIFPRDYSSTNLERNDQIEIINITAGG